MQSGNPRNPWSSLFLSWSLALLLSACRSSPTTLQARAEPAARRVFIEEPIRTTDADIAMRNLEAQIDHLQRLTARGASTAGQRAGLVELIAARAQYTGSVADREQALALAENLAREFPNQPVALLARARSRAALHRFAESLADLDHAAGLGASPAAVAGLRAVVYQALGRYDEAFALRRASAEHNPSADNLGALASVQAARGRVDDAARLFAEARWSYRDISPFPLAFLYFDEGAMWMLHGDLERARALFTAAHRRLPAFAAARCYLAEVEAALGERDAAIARLTPLARAADDPHAAALLARILADAGRADEAAAWRSAAARRYEELVAAHPDAYGDHAAELWLDAGGPTQFTLPLARHAPAPRRLARTSW
ncbi:MAG: tetratricopeptide repeat protein [Candidatus Binatia bacterium]